MLGRDRFDPGFGPVADGSFRAGPDGVLTAAGADLARLLGYGSCGETVEAAGGGIAWLEGLVPADLWGRLEVEGSVRVKVRLRRRDGAVLEGLLEARAVRDAAGRVAFYEGDVSDVAGAACGREHPPWEGVHMAMEDAVCIVDGEHVVRYANPAMLGLRGQVSGRPCYEYLYRRQEPCSECPAAGPDPVRRRTWRWVSRPEGLTYEVSAATVPVGPGASWWVEQLHEVVEADRECDEARIALGRERLLRESILAMAGARHAGAALHTMLDALRILIPCDRARVLITGAEEGRWLGAVLDPDGRIRSVVLPRSRSAEEELFLGRLLAAAGPVLAAAGEVPGEWGVGESGPEEWLCAPLRAGAELVGVLLLQAGSACRDRAGLGPRVELLAKVSAAVLFDAVRREALREDVSRVRGLARHLVEIRETERRAVARELRDEVSQTLVSLLLGLRLLDKELKERGVGVERVGELERAIDSAVDQLYRMAADLRPVLLERLGLEAALRQHLVRWQGQSGLEIRFKARGLDTERLPDVLAATLFRFSEELLGVIVRRAGAGRVDVFVELRSGRVVLVVDHDGAGLDDPLGLGGEEAGLAAMVAQVEALGGGVTAERLAGGGATLAVEVPDVHPDRDR